MCLTRLLTSSSTLQVPELLAASDLRPLHALLALQLRPQPPPPPPPHRPLRHPQRRLPTRPPPPIPGRRPTHLPPPRRPILPHLPHRSVTGAWRHTGTRLTVNECFVWGAGAGERLSVAFLCCILLATLALRLLTDSVLRLCGALNPTARTAQLRSFEWHKVCKGAPCDRS